MSSSSSGSVGMAVEHSRREETMAPAVEAAKMVFSRDHPDSRPWQMAPPKASPAPRPFFVVTEVTGISTRSVRVLASVPSRPCFTMASSTPASRRASAARSGSRSPTATSHSSRLPMATVTLGRILETSRWAVSLSFQNMGR